MNDLRRASSEALARHLKVMPVVIFSDGLEPTGAHLENILLHDLLVWRDSRIDSASLFYWRTSAREEVDFVIEESNRLIPIGVKASGRPRVADAKHLHTFREHYSNRSRCGLLLHNGETLRWITPNVLAAPWWRVI